MKDAKIYQVIKNIEMVTFLESLSSSNFTNSEKFYLDGNQGVVRKIELLSMKRGTGTLKSPVVVVYFFSADPGVLHNASDLSEAEADLTVGIAPVGSGDWIQYTTTAIYTLSLNLRFNLPGNEIWICGRSSLSFAASETDGEALKINELVIEYPVI